MGAGTLTKSFSHCFSHFYSILSFLSVYLTTKKVVLYISSWKESNNGAPLRVSFCIFRSGSIVFKIPWPLSLSSLTYLFLTEGPMSVIFWQFVQGLLTWSAHLHLHVHETKLPFLIHWIQPAPNAGFSGGGNYDRIKKCNLQLAIVATCNLRAFSSTRGCCWWCWEWFFSLPSTNTLDLDPLTPFFDKGVQGDQIVY